MVHIGYAYHRAFYEKHGLGIAGCVYLEECLFDSSRSLGDPFRLSADVWGRRKCLILGCILFLLRISMLFVHLDIHGFFFSLKSCWGQDKHW